MKSGSRLERILEKGEFAVTAELGPPKGSDVSNVEKKAAFLKGYADAVNVTDNQTAVVRMSSLATAVILERMGIEPVLQMVTRDRNRIALQGDLLGAAALGIKNVLCISGDHQVFGNQQYCKNVYDIDSIQLISALKRMRDEGKILDNDEELKGRPDMLIGAASTPFSEPVDFRPYRLKKKVMAGADFVQTQCIYDIELFKKFMTTVRELEAHNQCHILAGVTPLKSAGMARYMARKVPGVVIPDDIMKRIEGVPKEKAAEEGIKIACEQIQELKEIEGVHGIHLMAIEWEHRVPEIMERAGLLPRPEL